MSTPEYPYLAREALFSHQAEYMASCRDKEYWALFWQTGAAKTLPIILNAAYLYLRGEIDLMVVFAPNTVHANWIRREVPNTLRRDFPLATYIWDGATTQKAEQTRLAFTHSKGKLKIVAVNLEALSAHANIRENRAVLFLAQLIKQHEGRVMGVVDESDNIGIPSSRYTKRVLRFAQLFKYRRIATGTPVTESVFSAYTQSEFLKPGALGCDSYSEFTMRYGVFKRKQFGTGKAFNQLVGHRNLADLKARLSTFSSFVKKADCLDLPPKLYETREVTLTKEQQSAYDQMRILQLHQVTDEKGQGHIVMANSAMRKLALLHDIVIGYTRIPDPTHIPKPGEPQRTMAVRIPTHRIAVLDEEIARTEGKILIFSECKPAVIDVAAHLRKKHGEDTVVEFHGDIPENERQAGVDAFQDPASRARFFVGNKTAYVGLTLTEAHTVIFYSNGYRLKMRMQAEDRPHRPSQRNPVTYIDIVAKGTVDEKIFRSYQAKVDVASRVVDLFDFFMGEAVMTDDHLSLFADTRTDLVDGVDTVLEGTGPLLVC